MPVRDFLLDENGHLAVINGDFAVVGATPGMTVDEAREANLAAVVQGIRTRLLLFLGENWLDESIGTDWLGQILVKDPNPVVVHDLLRRVIAGTPDVVEVVAANLVIDNATRVATISFQVITAYSTEALSDSVEVNLS